MKKWIFSLMICSIQLFAWVEWGDIVEQGKKNKCLNFHKKNSPKSTSGQPIKVEVCRESLFRAMCLNLEAQGRNPRTVTIDTHHLKEKIVLQNNKELFEVLKISMFFKVVNTALPSRAVTSLPLTLSDEYSCIIDEQEKGSQFSLDLSKFDCYKDDHNHIIFVGGCGGGDVTMRKAQKLYFLTKECKKETS